MTVIDMATAKHKIALTRAIERDKQRLRDLENAAINDPFDEANGMIVCLKHNLRLDIEELERVTQRVTVC